MRTGDLRNNKNLSAYQVDNNLLGLGSYIDENGDQTISTLPIFCVNSGNVDSLGNPAIVSFVEGFSSINFNVGGGYPDLIITNYLGQSATLNSISSYDCSELSNGQYIVCVSLEGEVSLYKSSLYIQKLAPTSPVLDDIWLDISIQPVKAYKYNSSSEWEEFIDVPLGRVSIGGGIVESLEISNFNYTNDIINNLGNFANTDLSNTTDQAKILMSSMAMPSSKYIDLTLGASGTTYTAPANGWVYNNFATNQNMGIIIVANDTKGYGVSNRTNAGRALGKLLPVSKGDIFRVSYDGTATNYGFKFFYAVGSESEAS